MKTKSLSQTLNEAFESNINEAFEKINKSDIKDGLAVRVLMGNPSSKTNYRKATITSGKENKDGMYEITLDSGKTSVMPLDMIYVNESEDCDDDNVNEGNLLKQTNLSSAEYQKAKKLKDFNEDDYSWDGDNQLYKKKSSTNENVNENMISDFLSTLTSSESQLLLGAIGATGVVLASVAADKLINYIKKNEGSAGAKLIGKLETLGSSASATVHHK